jgi:hypothetical protein
VASFVNTFLVLIFGGIAFGIVSGLSRNMVPSLPPGFSHPASAEAEGSGHASWQFHFSHQQRFFAVFAILFTVSAWARLSRQSSNPLTSERATQVQRFGRRLSEGWFSLAVGNAFGAMIAAMAAYWIQQFSFSQILLHWLWAAIGTPIHGILAQIFGKSTAAIGAWFDWYNANQLKLSFWVFYLAAICDDLGLPNLKTLARFLWRRARGQNAVGCSACEDPVEPARHDGMLPPA